MASKDKLLANAQKFLSKGQVSKAISEYQKLVEAAPKDVRNRQKLAELLSRDKRNEEALTEYEAVAKHYTETGFYLKAIAVFKQMQKLEPSRVDIYHRLAELNEKQGLVGNALTEYRNLVSFYDKNKMHHEAIEVLEKMVALDPDNLNFSAKIAECYMAAGLEEKAYDRFKEIIDPLAAKGEHIKVVKLYERFLDICPEDAAARLPLAKSLVHSGSSGKAIQVLKGLLKNSPEDADVHRCLADAYVAEKDFSNARLTLKHILKQNKDDLDLLEYYARVCIDAGECERARDRLEEWKDAFLHADRIAILKGFYEELKGLLPGDKIVADTLSVIYEAVGEGGTLDEPVISGKDRSEAIETADGALSDDLLDDVEALEMVGEDTPADIEVPELEVEEPQEDLPAEKIAARGLELDLDLDLELEVAPPESPVLPTEEESPQEEEVPETETEAEDVEVEVEIDLDDMGDLDLDFEETEVAAEEPVHREEAADEDVEVSLDIDLETDNLSLDVELEPFEGVEDVTEPETLGSVTEEEIAEIEELDVVEDFEELEEVEELEEIEELEELEEVEELEALEDIETVEVAPVKSGFAAALNVDAELEEAEFYLQQGLYDDAERVVQTLLEYRPGMPELLAKLEEIGRERDGAEAEAESADFVDIMADLQDDDLLEATDFLDSFGADTQQEDELSQKLVSELDSADTESHFNLGIAYKEMGLYDDAIAEFDKAGQDPARTVDCITLTGQCYMESGNTDAAMEAFKSGLQHESLTGEGRMSLNFELGMLHQMNGQLLEALDCFQLVAEKDSFFRDVGELIKQLRKELNLDDSNDDDGPQGNRDRVSYV